MLSQELTERGMKVNSGVRHFQKASKHCPHESMGKRRQRRSGVDELNAERDEGMQVQVNSSVRDLEERLCSTPLKVFKS